MGRFSTLLPTILRHEGGFVDHPADPGGRTNQGITQRTYDAYRSAKGRSTQSVRHMADAERDDIYRTRYWGPIGGDRLPPPLDLVLFDSAVLFGPGRAIEWLQRALGVTPDRSIGPMTWRALERADPALLAQHVLSLRRAYHRHRVALVPSSRVFLKGWMNRVDELERTVRLARGSSSTRTPATTTYPAEPHGDPMVGGAGFLLGLVALAALLLL